MNITNMRTGIGQTEQQKHSTALIFRRSKALQEWYLKFLCETKIPEPFFV